MTWNPQPDVVVYRYNGEEYTWADSVTGPYGTTTFALPEGRSFRFRADQYDLVYWSGSDNHCEVPTCTEVTITALGFDYEAGDQTIEYTYDDLNRLTAADYDTGLYYHYTYDAVGNRTGQETAFVLDPLNPPTPTVTAYTFDNANRLATVNALPYTFDANGNLLSDGEYTYSYDTSNRLTGVTKAESTVSYRYNGDGDRLQQTVNGVENNYTLDLNSGLTQVLAYGDETYSYGLDRLGYSKYDDMYTYLPDALGSVRQVMKNSGEYPGLTLAKSYDPYGEVIYSNGATASYGFTGEAQDSTGMVYLRARYYNVSSGTFMSRDTWDGDANLPMSYNRWLYVGSNPINNVDPSGKCYGPVDWLRNVPLEDINCANLDKAITIEANPYANDTQKSMASAYIGAWGISHIYLLAGIGLTAYGSASAISAWAGPYVSYALTRYPFIGTVLNTLAVGSEGYLLYKAIFCNDQDAAAILTTGYLLTGNSAIADTIDRSVPLFRTKIEQTNRLLNSLAKQAVNNVGPGSGNVYGTEVHTEFKNLIKSLGRLDLYPEVSYLQGVPVKYGTPGSVRPDVVFGTPEKPIALFDLKTGTSTLTATRIAQIRVHLPPGYTNIPIIEVHP